MKTIIKHISAIVLAAVIAPATMYSLSFDNIKQTCWSSTARKARTIGYTAAVGIDSVLGLAAFNELRNPEKSLSKFVKGLKNNSVQTIKDYKWTSMFIAATGTTAGFLTVDVLRNKLWCENAKIKHQIKKDRSDMEAFLKQEFGDTKNHTIAVDKNDNVISDNEYIKWCQKNGEVGGLFNETDYELFLKTNAYTVKNVTISEYFNEIHKLEDEEKWSKLNDLSSSFVIAHDPLFIPHPVEATKINRIVINEKLLASHNKDKQKTRIYINTLVERLKNTDDYFEKDHLQKLIASAAEKATTQNNSMNN